jgi:hypothetical protein
MTTGPCYQLVDLKLYEHNRLYSIPQCLLIDEETLQEIEMGMPGRYATIETTLLSFH